MRDLLVKGSQISTDGDDSSLGADALQLVTTAGEITRDSTAELQHTHETPAVLGGLEHLGTPQ